MKDKDLAQRFYKIAQQKSREEFEETFEKLFGLDLPEKTKNYFQDKYNAKEKWSFAYKKSLPCLKVGTTSRIESLNSLIKKAVSSSSRLCELLHRLLKLHNNILNKPCPHYRTISEKVIKDLENITLLLELKNYLSKWAYEQCALNLSQSWTFEVKSQKNRIILEDKENEYKIELEKGTKTEPLQCKCLYWNTMGLPCHHIFAIAKQFPKLVDLKSMIRPRWLKMETFENYQDTSMIQFIDEYLALDIPNEDVKQSNQNAEVENNIEGIFNKIIKKFS